MKNSLRLLKVGGIPISIHWTFLILLAWIVFIGVREGGNLESILYSILFISLLFVCVVLHELGHALTAKRFDVITRSITLLPIGGVAQMDRIPEKPKEELLIAIAGPAVNFVLVILLYPFVYFFADINDFTNLSFITGKSLLLFLFIANIVMAVFNLVPAFPMDGGRILRALLSFRMGHARATRVAATIGQGLAIGFVFLGIFYNPFLILIGIFVFFGAQSESQYVQTGFLLNRYKVKDALIPQYPTIKPDATIGEAVKTLLNVQGKDFIISNNGNSNGRIEGILSRDQIIKALTEQGSDARVKDFMSRDIQAFGPDSSLDEVYRQMVAKNISVVPIVESGHLLGFTDLENILEVLMVNNALGKDPSNHSASRNIITSSSS